jgi:hypothetical protein
MSDGDKVVSSSKLTSVSEEDISVRDVPMHGTLSELGGIAETLSCRGLRMKRENLMKHIVLLSRKSGSLSINRHVGAQIGLLRGASG